MLTELCQELRNWFDRYQPKLLGKFIVENGKIYHATTGIMIPLSERGLQQNQYYRIIGSVFNDGVHKYVESESLTDEIFNGAVWFMAIPPAVISLAKDIEDWQTKYGETASSPFTSESFGGYSYMKGGSSFGGGSDSAATWQTAFKSRLNKWRKL